jgi:hypothetical protein
VDDDVLTAVYRRLRQRARVADLEEGRRAQVLRALEQAYEVLHDRERRRRYDLQLGGATDRAAVAVTSGAPAVIAVESPREVAAAQPASAPAASPRVLDFGRYAGWSLRQIALRDRDYLEWLRRTPSGRQYQAEIAAILTTR